MSDFKTIRDMKLENKKVLVRFDFNVPMKGDKITDYTRIDTSIKTIQFILQKKGIPVMMSHLGRPEGKKDPSMSLKPVAVALTQKLGKEVMMAPDCIGLQVENIVKSLKTGQLVLLENLRFYEGEEANAPDFVRSLAKLGDVYVNDAFGTAHRAHASTYGVPLELKKQKKEVGMGFLMEEELAVWKPLIERKGKGVAIVGGAKLKEKVKAVKQLSKKFDKIILGGVVANVFLKAKGIDIGSSRYFEKEAEKDKETYTEDAAKILKDSEPKLVIPEKVLITDKFDTSIEATAADGVDEGFYIVDIVLSDKDMDFIKKADKIVWFGPVGFYEKGFTEGTKQLVHAINASKAATVIGGGDLSAAAKDIKAKVSTGGGAAIEYIVSGKFDSLEVLRV